MRTLETAIAIAAALALVGMLAGGCRSVNDRRNDSPIRIQTAETVHITIRMDGEALTDRTGQGQEIPVDTLRGARSAVGPAAAAE